MLCLDRLVVAAFYRPMDVRFSRYGRVINLSRKVTYMRNGLTWSEVV